MYFASKHNIYIYNIDGGMTRMTPLNLPLKCMISITACLTFIAKANVVVGISKHNGI